MAIKLRILFFLLALPSVIFSQSKTAQYLDGTFSFAKYEGALAIHYSHLWQLGKSQKMGIGLGARATSYLGANQYYVTAPAKLTSGGPGPFVIFKENIIDNIDSLLVKSPLVTSINLSINIQYQLSNKFSAGFNIDALGFSFGSKKIGNYINGFTGRLTQGKPTTLNLLLTSDNDFGSLNSELFVRYKVNDMWSVKASSVFLFTEYRTDSKVQQLPEPNDRFRNKSLMFGLGITYQIK